MNQVLLTVSGEIDPQVEEKTARGERPQADYIALARAFPADLIDYAAARRITGATGRLLQRLGGPNLTLAWACFLLRRRYRVIFTDGEQVGIPLAFMFRLVRRSARPRLITIAHILSVPKKMIFFDVFGVQKAIDCFWVYSTWQRDFIQRRWGLPSSQVVFTPFMVDARFFAPGQVQGSDLLSGIPKLEDKPIICSVGLEYRDYPTLIEAVQGLDVQVIIAAASPWSKRPDTTKTQVIPSNVTVQRFSQYELRALYARSRFVIMPLFPVNFQAGVTAILEAMAMGKAVICSQTPGQTDIIVHKKTGVYVPPGDPSALRGAILHLLEWPEVADSMGKAGRQLVLAEYELHCYTERLKRRLFS